MRKITTCKGGTTVESSDIYALGIIAIQALTGLSPSEIPKESSSQALLWQDRAQVSNGLAAILNKMVRHNVSDRYPTAQAVPQELNLLWTHRQVHFQEICET